MQYLCSLIWPFVESYWACAVFCFSLKSRKTSPTYEMFLQEVRSNFSKHKLMFSVYFRCNGFQRLCMKKDYSNLSKHALWTL